MVARLFRTLPLLAVLAVVAAIIYVVVSWKHSPARAKEILIRAFTVITGVITGLFALASLYAWFEHNADVFDLFFTFFLAAALALVVTQVCRAVFLRHNPAYRLKPMKAKPVRRWPWDWFRR